MVANGNTNKPNCFIEFRVYDTEKFAIFQRFFTPLRRFTQKVTDPASIDDTQEFNAATTQEAFAVSPSSATTSESTQERKSYTNPEEWLLALRPQDLQKLGMPNHASAIQYLRDWRGISRRERRDQIKAADADTDQLYTLADFADMMRRWEDVQYELVHCEMTASDSARITYSTYRFPFEGKAALEETLLFFGFLSILNDSC